MWKMRKVSNINTSKVNGSYKILFIEPQCYNSCHLHKLVAQSQPPSGKTV